MWKSLILYGKAYNDNNRILKHHVPPPAQETCIHKQYFLFF